MIGRIYIITGGDKVYVGSTFNSLKTRFSQHIWKYKNWKEGKHHNVSVFEIFEESKIENCQIYLVKEYPVVDKYNLFAYEQLWINKIKCVNQQPTISWQFLTEKEYQKKYGKIYYQKNKERIKERVKKYQDENKEKIKEKRSESKKRWKKTKVKCEVCNTEITNAVLAKHRRTKKHLKNLENN